MSARSPQLVEEVRQLGEKKGSGLLPGWEAINDPGGTYYYNSSTGESTYEKPVLARTITRTPTLIRRRAARAAQG